MKLNGLTEEVLYNGWNTWRRDIHQLCYYPFSSRLTKVCSLPLIPLFLVFEYLLWVLLQCFTFDMTHNFLLWNLQKIYWDCWIPSNKSNGRTTPIERNLTVKTFFPLVNKPANRVFAPFDVAIPAVKKVRTNDCQAVSNCPFFIFFPVM